MSSAKEILASPLEGLHLVQEIDPNTTHPQAQRLLSLPFVSGSFNYRGLVLKYHKVIDKETGKVLGTQLPEVPTGPITMQTNHVIERLTGLCLQLDLLTLESLDQIIRSGGFYQQIAEQDKPFTPSPELDESLQLLLRLEAIVNHNERIQELTMLEDQQWKRYMILHKARNKAVGELLRKLPGLLSDSLMRTWFIVTLDARMPRWVSEAQERRSQGFLYTQLHKA